MTAMTNFPPFLPPRTAIPGTPGLGKRLVGVGGSAGADRVVGWRCIAVAGGARVGRRVGLRCATAARRHPAQPIADALRGGADRLRRLPQRAGDLVAGVLE